ncbi:hypothetical protein SCLCIDRAFT_156510 [Scleroderma citrinum Foug A]|uniref:Uncharacterized protein n=1 Tax=Scleroderma citrinum Foug A TaxID=1036808 RepID=A0A0C3AA49_9AGAM|nr:hypothetical protein SCLCIDRAFT_156510 [Scleroderma citrinum Foug A]
MAIFDFISHQLEDRLAQPDDFASSVLSWTRQHILNTIGVLESELQGLLLTLVFSVFGVFVWSPYSEWSGRGQCSGSTQPITASKLYTEVSTGLPFVHFFHLIICLQIA